MNYSESVVSFECEGDQLMGILSQPSTPTECGVVIVVGGPQYRIGSHRQFVLLARHIAEAGFAALRFDYRGMGDSSGKFRDFTAIDRDLRAAVDAIQRCNPKLQKVVVWGLCDAATAALFYAPSDQRIVGLVLANPWVRTIAGEAQAYLSHYYRSRFLDITFWKKIFTGQFDFFGSLTSFLSILTKAKRNDFSVGTVKEVCLREKMYSAWDRFSGNVLVLLSGEDLTAKEFTDMVAASPRWRALLDNPRVTTHKLPSANHTFSRTEWRNEVAAVTAEWIKNL